MTESSGHLSEYLQWFRKSQKALETYCDQPLFGGESGIGYKFHSGIAEKFEKTDYLSYESGKLKPRSAEYCSYILEAKETGKPFKLNGNVINNNYITNLPDGCCVEVPVFIDKMGLHPVTIGDLPLPLAAMNQSNVTVQMLAAATVFANEGVLLKPHIVRKIKIGRASCRERV